MLVWFLRNVRTMLRRCGFCFLGDATSTSFLLCTVSGKRVKPIDRTGVKTALNPQRNVRTLGLLYIDNAGQTTASQEPVSTQIYTWPELNTSRLPVNTSHMSGPHKLPIRGGRGPGAAGAKNPFHGCRASRRGYSPTERPAGGRHRHAKKERKCGWCDGNGRKPSTSCF